MKNLIMTYLFILIWIALIPFAVSKIVNGSFSGALGYRFDTGITETVDTSESAASEPQYGIDG